MPVVFATQDSSILIRSQSAASLVTIRTWMGAVFWEEKKNQLDSGFFQNFTNKIRD